MEFTAEQEALYKRACDTLLFDDLYGFILSLWPEKIDTSMKSHVNYEDMRGIIDGLQEFDHDFLEDLEIGNLLVHLNYAVKIAVHRCGLCLDSVCLRDINTLYVRYWFEDKTLSYAVTDNQEEIPIGFRESLDTMFNLGQVKEYFRRNKVGLNNFL